MQEEWKDVPGYEGYYQVSSLGRVKSLGHGTTHKSERILKNSYARKGKRYRTVTFSKNGISATKRVCRLVWSAFNGPIPEGMQVNHINEVCNDDRLENLNLMTARENNNWGTRTERATTSNINHPNKSIPVAKITENGNILEAYPSSMQAERETGINHRHILSCCHGKYGFKTAGGYYWKFI